MEVGWYLRFPRGGRIIALVDAQTVPQLEHQLHIVSGWAMETKALNGHVQATFTQQKA